MKYVGATNGFIRGPFVVEGIIIGLIAALLTILMVGVAYDFIIEKMSQSDVLQKMSISLMTFSQLSRVIAIVFLALGIGIGVIGSSISMKRYLEV